LKELWLDRLTEILIANPAKLHFGQEVLYGDLQILYYDMDDMNTPYPNIEEKLTFIIFLDFHTCRKKSWGTNSRFGGRSNSTPKNSQNFFIESISAH
jgi:hypothetical protein